MAVRPQGEVNADGSLESERNRQFEDKERAASSKSEPEKELDSDDELEAALNQEVQGRKRSR